MWSVASPAEKKDGAKLDSTTTARSPIRRRRSLFRDLPLQRRSNARRIPNNDAPSASGINTARQHYYNRNIARLELWESERDRREPAARNPPLPPVPESRNYARDSTSTTVPNDTNDALDSRRDTSDAIDRVMDRLESAHARLDAMDDRINPFSRLSTRTVTVDEYREQLARSGTSNPAPAFPHRRLGEPLAEWPSPRYPFEFSQSRTQQIPSTTTHTSQNNPTSSEQVEAATYDFPPLRRMSNRLDTITLLPSPPPYTSLDGLGDRDHSFSPDDDHHVDHWQTMHSTIAPDTHLPSADSSFTSAAASASFSRASAARTSTADSRSTSATSASSRVTDLTVPSQRASSSTSSAEEAALRDCIIVESDGDTTVDDDEDTEAEDGDEETRELGDRIANARHPDDPPPRDPYRYASGVRLRSRDARRVVRSYYRWVDDENEGGARETRERDAERQRVRDLRARILGGPTREMRDQPAALETEGEGEGEGENEEMEEEPALEDLELEQMRGILERLARRHDIPDEWWMSAGLTPMIAGRIGRVGRERL